MADIDTQLDDLERRVVQRYLEKVNVDWSLPEFSFDFAAWTDELSSEPVGPALLHFPREQWIVYPGRRYVSLLVAERMLNAWDELTLERRHYLAVLLTVGGRERLQ